MASQRRGIRGCGAVTPTASTLLALLLPYIFSSIYMFVEESLEFTQKETQNEALEADPVESE